MEDGYGVLPILNRTGALMRSWIGGPGHTQKVTQTSISFGSTLKIKGGHNLAAIHHYGGAWYRPAITAKKGGKLRFWAGGRWIYRTKVKAAYIVMPDRPVIGVDGLPPAEDMMVRTIFKTFVDRWMVSHGHPA